jgi:hypothetical protein
MELSGSAEVMEAVQSMYPVIAGAVTRDGKLYGVPVRMSGETFGLNRALWEDLGFAEDEIPTTFYELIEFAANWDPAEYPEINLFDQSSSHKELLLGRLNDLYIAYQSKQGQALDFDTELYRKLIKAMDGMEDQDFSDMEAGDEEEFWSRETLFNTYIPIGQYYSGWEHEAMILPLDEGLEPVIPVSLDVLIINPRTTRPDQTLMYLASCVKYFDPESANISMFPDHNEPVPNNSYDQMVKSMQENLAISQKQLETAKPEDVAGIKEMIKYEEEWLANPEANRFNVSAEQIENYRTNIAPYLHVMEQTPFQQWDSNGRNEFYDMMRQYLDGAIPAEQYAKEVSMRLRMMALEAQ